MKYAASPPIRATSVLQWSPESSVELARAIVGSISHYHAGVAVARKAVELLRGAHNQNRLRITANEVIWFDTLQHKLDELPEAEAEFIAGQLAPDDRDC